MVIKVGPFEFPVKLQIEIIGKSVTVRSFFPGFGNKFSMCSITSSFSRSFPPWFQSLRTMQVPFSAAWVEKSSPRSCNWQALPWHYSRVSGARAVFVGKCVKEIHSFG